MDLTDGESLNQRLEEMGLDFVALMDSFVESTAMLDRPLYQVRDKPNQPYCDIICGGCKSPASIIEEYMQCTQCKAVKYCSKDCQRLDWKMGGLAAFCYKKHKLLCPILKAANEEFNSSEDKGKSLRKYFLWADQHHPKVDSFFEPQFLARLGLYKRSDTSFWSMPSPVTGVYENLEAGTTKEKYARPKAGSFHNGVMLLRSKFPPLSYGWVNLKEGEYPPPVQAPKDTSKLPIKNWKQYMEYRGLSPTSVAPLLLHNILTVYEMLKELNMQSGEKLVYMLGPEIELNMIPLFGELAYLMPNADLTLIMVSPSVKKICDESRSHPDSIISKAPALGPNIVVYENNPTNFGRIRIALYPNKAYFHEARDLPKCQAALGLNAGIEAYTTWHPTLLQLVRSDIPFVFSDHSVISIEGITGKVIPGIHSRNTDFRPLGLESKLNPFHSPVTRDIGIMVLPNVNNGYLLFWRGQKGDPEQSPVEYQRQEFTRLTRQGEAALVNGNRRN